MIPIVDTLMSAEFLHQMAWAVAARPVVGYVHEGGHAVMGVVTGHPINGFGPGIPTLGWGWYWDSDTPWKPLNGKWRRIPGGWNPHVTTWPYPAAGRARALKSIGGPLASLLGPLLVLAIYAGPLWTEWAAGRWYLAGDWLAAHMFLAGIVVWGFFDFVGNMLPTRQIGTLLLKWEKSLPFRLPRLERFASKRAKSRMFKDGERFYSAISRWRSGRTWKRIR